MVQFTIVNESLKIIDDTKTVVFIAKKDVFAISQSLYQAEPIADIYNLNLGYLGLVFTRKLSECLDPDGNVFTVDSFILFVETYLGFETGVIPQTITVVLNYSDLPDPTTVSGQFYWCEEAYLIYPLGLYYSNGVSWEYQSGSGTVTSVTAVSPITSSGGITPEISTSMATNKLIGRRSGTTTGVMEEITVGDGLTLTGAGILNNTATPTPTGYYGAWQDDATQSALSNNTGYAMILGTVDLENQVRVVTNGTNLTRITFDNTGIYNLQFSSQFQNTDNSDHDVTIWIRLNGVDVTGSAGLVQVPKRTSASVGDEGHTVVGWNYLLSVIAGQYYEIIWSTNDYTKVTMKYYSAGNPPPSTASVIATVTQQAGIMGGTGITALNGLTGAVQTFSNGYSGTAPVFNSSGTVHTLNIPLASTDSVTAGLLSNTDYNNFKATSASGSFFYYYFNGSVSASVPTYYQISPTANIAVGANFTIAGNGLISQWLSNVGNPSRTEIPAGNWNFEMYMSASSAGGTPAFYVELLKYNGSTFTSIANSSASPKPIIGGTSIDLYLTALAVPLTSLLITDRLAIRVYIVSSVAGRSITMYTQDAHVSQVITNFPSGISSLNGLTTTTQLFQTTTSGTDFGIVSSGNTHSFNMPSASATARGVVTTGSQTFAGSKTFSSNITMPATGTPLILSVGSGGFIEGLSTSTYPSLTELSYVKGVTSAIQTQINSKQASLTNPVTGTGTNNEISYFNTTGSTIGSLSTTTYPSLTELSYVKGVTSAIQTQINGKQFGTIIVTSGTSFTTPANITASTIFIIELVGAGGGGGGSPNTALAQGSSGGGGGYVYKKITGLTASTTYTCAIGTGGNGGAFTGNGTAGGNTTLTIGITTYTASGGGFGIGAVSSSGGAGGTGTNGDINITGQSGGSVGTATVTNQPPAGGSPKGWGLGGQSVNANGNGASGTGYGGGGSAGHGNTGSPTGGAGSNGIIYCEYYN